MPDARTPSPEVARVFAAWQAGRVDAERMLCVEALARSGSIIKAARLLGILRLTGYSVDGLSNLLVEDDDT